MPSEPNGRQLQELKVRIDQIPELSGSGIGFIGDGVCTTLRQPRHSSGLDTWALLEERALEDDENLPNARDVQEPSLAMELVGAGMKCAGAGPVGGGLAGAALAGGAPVVGSSRVMAM